MNSNVCVVGVDGSEVSNEALDWAIQYSKTRNFMVRVACAYRMPSYVGAGAEAASFTVDESAVREGAEAVVDTAAERVRAAGLEVETIVDPADPSGLLIDLSKHAATVVCGTRGGGGFKDRLLGAVPSALPSHSYSPAVVVPMDEEKSFMPIRRIVVGVDGSPTARNALAHAMDLAEEFDAELTAVAAVPMSTGAGAMAWVPASIDHRAILRDVEASMEEMIQAIGEGRNITVRRRALDGNPAALLSEFSTAVDLVVVGTRGRGGFSGLLLGSTSQTLISHAACPVMVIPARASETTDEE